MTTVSSKKILVVDDDSNFLKLIRIRLELAGYEVVTALNEDEAIAIAKEEIFALSIVDLKLVRQGWNLFDGGDAFDQSLYAHHHSHRPRKY